jgi:hypothetical protein
VKTTLRTFAAVLLLGALALWLAAGASRGWTKTSVPVKTLDAVTGIEAINYQKRFVPGLDFLGGALVASGLLAGVSLFFRNQNKPTTNTDPNA